MELAPSTLLCVNCENSSAHALSKSQILNSHSQSITIFETLPSWEDESWFVEADCFPILVMKSWNKNFYVKRWQMKRLTENNAHLQ